MMPCRRLCRRLCRRRLRLLSSSSSRQVIKGMTHFIERSQDYSTLTRALEDLIKAADVYEYDLTSPGSG